MPELVRPQSENPAAAPVLSGPVTVRVNTRKKKTKKTALTLNAGDLGCTVLPGLSTVERARENYQGSEINLKNNSSKGKGKAKIPGAVSKHITTKHAEEPLTGPFKSSPHLLSAHLTLAGQSKTRAREGGSTEFPDRNIPDQIELRHTAFLRPDYAPAKGREIFKPVLNYTLSTNFKKHLARSRRTDTQIRGGRGMAAKWGGYLKKKMF